MKKTLIILLLTLMPTAICAQQKKSDTVFEGLNGKVKTVVLEMASVTNKYGKQKQGNRTLISISTYDESGNLLRVESYSKGKLISKRSYFDIGRYRAMKEGDLLTSEDKGIESEPRFILKRKYKYDSQGNRIEEEVYNGGNKLVSKLTHSYDSQGFLVETRKMIQLEESYPRSEGEISFGRSTLPEVKTTTYKRDDKGNLIELTEDKVYTNSFSDYEFDDKGNWIKRRARKKFLKTENKKETISIEYRKITYY